MICTVTQFVRESVGLCPFRRSYAREFELLVKMLVFAPLNSLYVKERKLFTKKIKKQDAQNRSLVWDALVYASIMAFYLNLGKLGKSERCVML